MPFNPLDANSSSHFVRALKEYFEEEEARRAAPSSSFCAVVMVLVATQSLGKRIHERKPAGHLHVFFRILQIYRLFPTRPLAIIFS